MIDRTSIDAERYQRLALLFQELSDLSPEKRQPILDAIGSRQAYLRREVEQLLGAHDTPRADLELPVLGPSFRLESADELSDSYEEVLVGATVGDCRLERFLAAGGMGSVYEAHEAGTGRSVAVKVLHRWLGSSESRKKLDSEVRILSRLNHPSIARIYRTGVLDPGKIPCFVMELIPESQSVTEHLATNRLSLGERLALFLAVCDGVEHGHQNGIIHRDLKPDNLLVGSDGLPKIIDFGVARATDSRTLSFTGDSRKLFGTLQYMSPEHCSGIPSEIDVRSDVYSLGVVLFELLTGSLPYSVAADRIPEAIRIISESNPRSLRSVDPGLRGDLEVIVEKALAREKKHRYPSVSELAADLRRYLRNEPISARPPTLSYQLWKLARRNPGVTLASAGFLTALLLGSVFTTFFALRAEEKATAAIQAQNSAEDSLDEANLVASLMLDVMSSWKWARKDKVDILTLLQTTENVLESQSVENPGVKARLHEFLGKGFLVRNQPLSARKHVLEALRIREESIGILDPDLARCHLLAARLSIHVGEIDLVRKHLREMLRARRVAFGPEHLERDAKEIGYHLLTYVPEEPEAQDFSARLEETRTRVQNRETAFPSRPQPSPLNLLFDENFDEPLSPSWQSPSADGWTWKTEDSRLFVTRAQKTSPTDPSRIVFSRNIAPLDNFHVRADLGWKARDNRGAGSLVLQLGIDDHNHLVEVWYTDGWVGWTGSLGGSFERNRARFPVSTSTGRHTMPREGRASFDLQRQNGRTVVLWDSREFMVGLPTEPFTTIRLIFTDPFSGSHEATNTEFSPMWVESLSVSGRRAESR